MNAGLLASRTVSNRVLSFKIFKNIQYIHYKHFKVLTYTYLISNSKYQDYTNFL